MVTVTLMLSPWGLLGAVIAILLGLVIPMTGQEDSLAAGLCWALLFISLAAILYFVGYGVDAMVMLQ